jgi:Protein of unknown function (DUF4242)
MKTYVVEREIPGVGGLSPAQLQKASATSNAALAQLPGRIQWNHSYRTADKTFCLYLAEDEEAVREHARISGFPASKITEVKDMFDPTTAG